jgi:hypothetical protein
MAKTFIVRADDQRGTSFAGVLLTPSSAIVLVGTLSLARTDMIVVQQYLKYLIVNPLMSTFMIATAFLVLLGMSRRKVNEVRLAIYPIGIQLESRDKKGRFVGEPLFLARENVVDCIVTESILAHKVRSVVVLRMRGNELIEAFPGVDLTYSECLVIRHEINNLL